MVTGTGHGTKLKMSTRQMDDHPSSEVRLSLYVLQVWQLREQNKVRRGETGRRKDREWMSGGFPSPPRIFIFGTVLRES